MTNPAAIVKKNAGLFVLGAVVFVATALAAAPATFIPLFADFERSNISYSGVSGTIWNGSFRKLAVSGAPVGDVHFRLSPLSLLTLSPHLDLRSEGGALRGAGAVLFGFGRASVSNADIDIDLGPFAKRGILGEPVTGAARMKIDRIAVSKSGCKAAQAELWTDVLNGPAKKFRGPDMPMEGDIRCDGPDMVIALAGENGNGSAEIEIRIRPDMTYELAATARPAQEDVASALLFFGFEENGDELIYGSAGVLRGAGS